MKVGTTVTQATPAQVQQQSQQSPAQQSPVQQSPVQSAPVQSAIAGSSGQAAPAPTQAAKSALLVQVPKGQLGRVRSHIPNGWLSDGKHHGFKAAHLSPAAEGIRLNAVNPADIPRGQRKQGRRS